MVIQIVSQKVLSSGLILPTAISIRGVKTPIQQFRSADRGNFDQKPYTATRYQVVVKGRDVILVPGYAGYWQMWDTLDNQSDTIKIHPRNICPCDMNEPLHSAEKQYKVWHGLRSASPKHGTKSLEYVEACSGILARQKVVEKYPDHVVGHAILIIK